MYQVVFQKHVLFSPVPPSHFHSTREAKRADRSRNLGTVDPLEVQDSGPQKPRGHQGGAGENSVC